MLLNVLVIPNVNDTIFLGAHDVKNCQESEGCVEVEVTHVWDHENFDRDNFPVETYNDIGLAK